MVITVPHMDTKRPSPRPRHLPRRMSSTPSRTATSTVTATGTQNISIVETTVGSHKRTNIIVRRHCERQRNEQVVSRTAHLGSAIGLSLPVNRWSSCQGTANAEPGPAMTSPSTRAVTRMILASASATTGVDADGRVANRRDEGLSAGEKAAIAFCVLLAVAMVCWIAFLILRYESSSQQCSVETCRAKKLADSNYCAAHEQSPNSYPLRPGVTGDG